MNPNSSREKELFNAAVELSSPAERAALLDRECAGDAELRASVEALLRSDAEATAKFLDSPAGPTPPLVAATIRVTPLETDDYSKQTIGRYKLLEKIGEGGFGAVYVAEQTEPVRRRVALKVIKLGMDTKQVVARFEAERQALAMMDHPNIAKVLDGGATEAGRPYFVMELVRGIRITEYCDQNNLSTKERLDLFVKVCQAIQHAHQKGIIHRDIKPSNILVTLNDGLPVPKVIDFGIAKATEGRLTDATVYTQLHQFMGTPAYMSPEQAEMSSLDIDTRSDIYSLGVLLYELLAGSTPFDAQELMASGIDAMRKTIREQEPPRPSTKLAALKADEQTTTARRRSSEAPKLIRQLSGDLDWIVMKCLEKDRTRRYETANGVAADIGRHLNNEPVLASPPSKLYEFQKSVRRHKAGFTAAAIVVITLFVGIVVSTWQTVRATRAEHTANLESERAAKAETVALREKETARQALAKSQLDLAEKEFEKGNFVEAKKILDETPESFRDANWRFLRAHSRDFTAQLSIPGNGSAHRLLFLPQGDHFAVKCWNGRSGVIGIFSLAGRQVVSWVQIGGHYSGTFGIDSTGSRIAFAASANEVVVQDVETGKLVRRWKCDIGEIKHVMSSPGGGTVLVVSERQVIAYSVQTGKPLWKHPSTAIVPAFSTDGGVVAILAAKSEVVLKVQILDTLTGDVRSTLETTADNPEKTTLQFNQAGDRLACLGGDELILWDAQTAVKIRALHFLGEKVMLLSPGGETLATTSGSRIRLWDAKTGRLLRSLNGASTGFWDIAFSADGKLLLSSHVAANDGIVHVWPTLLGNELASVRTGSLEGTRTEYSSVAFNHDGSRFYACAGSAGGWETQTGLQTWKASATSPVVLDLAIHPTQGSILLSEFRQAFTHVSSDGNPLEPFGSSDYSSLTFNRSGKLLLSVDNAFSPSDSGRAFRLMEYPSGKVVRKIPSESPRQPFAAFCLDESAVATAAKAGGITVWDWQAGKVLRQISAAQTGSIGCIASRSDGQQLASGGPDRWIRVWEAATGKLKIAFRAHWEGVRCLKFSPDGLEILSGSDDGTVRLHDAATGEHRLAFYGLNTPVVDVDVSADGKLIAAITEDGLTKVWNRNASSDAALLTQALTAKKPTPKIKTSAANKPAMTKDTEGWEDAFAQLTPAMIEKTGHEWTLDDGELVSPDKKFATLPLPGKLSGTNYSVRVKLRQLPVRNVFHLVLPVADRMCGLDLETLPPNGGIFTSISLVNGKWGSDVPGAVEGKQVTDNEPHDLEVTVRLAGTNAAIIATLDTRPLYSWTGPTAALSQGDAWATTEPGLLALGTYAGGWVVSEVKVKRLAAQAKE